MGVRYQKYRSIAKPLNISIELSQVLRYFNISNIDPALLEIIKNLGFEMMSIGHLMAGAGLEMSIGHLMAGADLEMSIGHLMAGAT